jgi:hypothetical protein
LFLPRGKSLLFCGGQYSTNYDFHEKLEAESWQFAIKEDVRVAAVNKNKYLHVIENFSNQRCNF